MELEAKLHEIKKPINMRFFDEKNTSL